MLPQGFYRANPIVPGLVDAHTGAALGKTPESDPFWPGFVRYRLAPRKTLPEIQPSMQRADWYMYCGPGPAGSAAQALQWLSKAAWDDGWWLYGEFVAVHPSTPSYQWPTYQLTCYPWQAELRRPRAWRATWDGYALRYALSETTDDGPEGRLT